MMTALSSTADTKSNFITTTYSPSAISEAKAARRLARLGQMLAQLLPLACLRGGACIPDVVRTDTLMIKHELDFFLGVYCNVATVRARHVHAF